MDKKKQIWTAVTPQLHSKLKDYGLKNKLAATRSKMVMYILQNYRPKQLLEDYTFISKEGKMINIKVNSQEVVLVEELAHKYGLKTSRLLRNMAYTYFRDKGEIT
jgi:hypothetical protein